jgi:hypothetical protein
VLDQQLLFPVFYLIVGDDWLDNLKRYVRFLLEKMDMKRWSDWKSVLSTFVDRTPSLFSYKKARGMGGKGLSLLLIKDSNCRQVIVRRR